MPAETMASSLPQNKSFTAATLDVDRPAMPFRYHSIGSACLPLLLIAGLAATGCSKSHQLETAPVTGRVTIDGKPVSSGIVMFTPDRGRGASGLISPDGTFRLTTYSEGDGAVLGLHRISISAIETSGQESGQGPSKFPSKYADESTSGFSHQVMAGEQNFVELFMQSSP